MFADNAKIFIKSGKGGDGHVSFRRSFMSPAAVPTGETEDGAEILFSRWIRGKTPFPISAMSANMWQRTGSPAADAAAMGQTALIWSSRFRRER